MSFRFSVLKRLKETTSARYRLGWLTTARKCVLLETGNCRLRRIISQRSSPLVDSTTMSRYGVGLGYGLVDVPTFY